MAWYWPFRRRVEQRVLQTPFNVGPSALGDLFGGNSVRDALGLIPVYAAARLLADSVASLPLQAYRADGPTSTKLDTLPRLFVEPGGRMELYPWLFEAMTSLVLRGNAFGLITSRDGYGYPANIAWLNPERVRVDDSAVPRFWYDGREIPREDMFHVPAFVVPGCTAGMSPIRLFATTIGAGKAMAEYGATWFAAGGFPTGTFRNTAQLVEQEAAEAIKGRLTASIRQRTPLVFGSDWEYTPITVPPEEAQFIMASQLNAAQVAAIYGIPPERIGGSTSSGSLTYANVEQNEIAFQSSAIRPWVTRLERAFSTVLPARVYVKFNMGAALRSDLLTRYESYKIARVIGLASVNELRALEELPPVPSGDDVEPLAAVIATDAPSAPATPASSLMRAVS